MLLGPPRTEQILWPRHCVQRTWGAELHPKLKVKKKSSRNKDDLTKTKMIKKTRLTEMLYPEIVGCKSTANIHKKDKIVYSSKPNPMKKTDALCPENMGAN